MSHSQIAAGENMWVFGYGSLIWRPDFEHVQKQVASVSGYGRRFCQASHDHRGTPVLPGRVVTLVPTPGGSCKGVAYQLPEKGKEAILDYLDEREQDGYERLDLALNLEDGQQVTGLTWVAREGNPSWCSEESLDTVARLIAERQGPSGTNRDYLCNLELALDAAGMSDNYVSTLALRVRSLATDS